MADDLLQELRELEVALHQPQVRSDAGRIDELLHESFVEFGRSGRSYDKAHVLWELPAEQISEAIWSQDFSPASIEHAKAEAVRDGLACDYRQQDLREGGFGSYFQAVLFVFGEFNAFPPDAAADILASARKALAPGGLLILELHTEESVRELGQQSPSWFTADRGLFSPDPHLCLREAC